jgi:hypothetical protein
MTPIRWGGQAQWLPHARTDLRPEMPAFFTGGMRSGHHGRAVGWTESVGDGASPPLLRRAIVGDRLHRALDA